MICPRCEHDNIPGDDYCASCQFDLATLDLPYAFDRVQIDLMQRAVRDLKPRPPVVLPLGAPLAEAIRIMLDQSVGAVLIVDEDGRIRGILSERDLLQRVPDEQVAQGQNPVNQYMTRDPETVHPDDSLALALHRMDVGGYRHLPVVIENDQPIGIISVRDLIRHITELCREVSS